MTVTWTTWERRPAGVRCTRTASRRATWGTWTCRSSTMKAVPRPTTRTAWSRRTWFARATRQVIRTVVRATAVDRLCGSWTTNGSRSSVRTWRGSNRKKTGSGTRRLIWTKIRTKTEQEPNRNLNLKKKYEDHNLTGTHHYEKVRNGGPGEAKGPFSNNLLTVVLSNGNFAHGFVYGDNRIWQSHKWENPMIQGEFKDINIENWPNFEGEKNVFSQKILY